MFGANFTGITAAMITFELNAVSSLQLEYFRLRERCYRAELGLAGFDGGEEAADRLGDLLIAHAQGRCVGGARIVNAELAPRALAGEITALDESCVWERFSLNPEDRSSALAKRFFDELVGASWRLGYRQALMYSSLRNARFYRMCARAAGAEFKIVGQLDASSSDAFDGLEHYVSVARWQPPARGTSPGGLMAVGAAGPLFRMASPRCVDYA